MSSPTFYSDYSYIINESSKIENRCKKLSENFDEKLNEIKEAFAMANDNIVNYRGEIKRLESFLVELNEHEKNYNGIMTKLLEIKKNLEETVKYDRIVKQMSANQQNVDISTYLTIYEKLKKLYIFFNSIDIGGKENFLKNLNNLMLKGFRVYQDSFNIMLRRYEQIILKEKNNINKENFLHKKSGDLKIKTKKNVKSNIDVNTVYSEEDEKAAILTKISALAKCLKDEKVNINFTDNLVKEHSQKMIVKIDELKFTLKNIETGKKIYTKGKGITRKILEYSITIFEEEHLFISQILGSCDTIFIKNILTDIIEKPIDKVADCIKEVINSQKNFDNSLAFSMPYDFFHNMDILDFWLENAGQRFEIIIENINFSQDEKRENLRNNLDFIKKSFGIIRDFCIKYLENFFERLKVLNNEKLENESVLSITNCTDILISNLILYTKAYKEVLNKHEKNKLYDNNNNIKIKANNNKYVLKNSLTPDSFIDILINKIHEYSSNLAKKYVPLKYIALINNYYFIYLKIKNDGVKDYFNEQYFKSLSDSIENCISRYVESTWKKVQKEVFENNMKEETRDFIKKKFSTFNEEMRLNLAMQRHIMIISKDIEMRLINGNIHAIVSKYDIFLRKYENSGFTKYKDKYILYRSAEDVIVDLKLYFSANDDINNLQ